MSLILRVGDELFTNFASNIQTKNIAEGGFASVTFNVKRKLDQSLFDAFTDVMTFDPETGEQTGGGRLLTQGRNDDGTWKVTCLGEGLASLQDVTTPAFYIDKTLDFWRLHSRTTRRLSASVSTYPGYNDSVLMCQVTEGQVIAVGSDLVMVNRLPELCDMSIGAIGFEHKSGVSSTTWQLRLRAYNAAMSGGETFSHNWATALSSRIVKVVGTDITSALRPIAAFEWERITSTVTSTDDSWSAVRDPIIQAEIYNADGTLKTTGYTSEWFYPYEIATDWVVRHCPRLDADAGWVSTASTEQVEQMAYVDGVHGMQLLADLKEIEAGYTWQVWEQGDNGRWPFYYQPFPTTVQYEASATNGFNAPSPSSEIYNKVTVTGKAANGRDLNLTLTSTVDSLDAASITREATISLGSEVWSTAAATKVGNEFLADHEFPPNAGTITISQPIYDNLSGRWIKPCNVRAGGLMRVHGIQPSPDTLNTTAPDGVTVFRVVSATHDNDSNSVVCELDAYELTESRAITELTRARTRR